MPSQKKEVTFPYAKAYHIKAMLLTLNKTGEARRERLAKEMNASISTLSNTVPILETLGIIEIPLRGYIGLTNRGKQIVNGIKNEDVDRLQTLFKKILPDSEVLSFALDILKINPNIDGLQLGYKIADKFNKEWQSEAVYRLVGNSCIDILTNFNLIEIKYISRGSKGRYGTPDQGGLRPTASSHNIFKLMTIMNPNSPTDLNQIPDSKKQRFVMHFKMLIDLGIVEHVDDRKFKFTVMGKQLYENLNTERRHEIFRKLLFNSQPVIKTMIKLIESDNLIDSEEVANALQDINNANWTYNTKRPYGLKFLTWLKEAELVQKSMSRKYIPTELMITELKKIKPNLKVLELHDGISLTTRWKKASFIEYETDPNTVPLSRISDITKILIGLYKIGECDRERLSAEVNLHKNNIGNAIPLLLLLDWIDINKINIGLLSFTSLGKDISHSIIKNEKDKTKEIFSRTIDNSNVLKYTTQILKNNPKIKTHTLGKKIGDKFGKTYTRTVYIKIGGVCKGIIAYFGDIPELIEKNAHLKYEMKKLEDIRKELIGFEMEKGQELLKKDINSIEQIWNAADSLSRLSFLMNEMLIDKNWFEKQEYKNRFNKILTKLDNLTNDKYIKLHLKFLNEDMEFAYEHHDLTKVVQKIIMLKETS